MAATTAPTTSPSTSEERTTILVTIRVSPTNVDEFLAGLKISYSGCVSEPELLFFEVFQEQDDPGCFHLFEVWARNRKWFETVQLQKPYYEPYLAATEHLWVQPRVITYVDAVPGWRTATKGYVRNLAGSE